MEENNKKTNINWFPGHMQKAKRQMMESINVCDIVIELRDARIPMSSYNPMLDDIINNKPRLIVLTKKDMADNAMTNKWIEYFNSLNIKAVAVNSNGDNLKVIIPNLVKEICKDKLERAKARGIRHKVLRAMVCGIPNVGKSTLINGIVKKRVAKVENRPGVTKTLQWIKINEDVELLDTPGVLWPRFNDQDVAIRLAILGSLNDQVVDKRALVLFLLEYLCLKYPKTLEDRYEFKINSNDPHQVLEDIAKARSFYKSEGELDLVKTIEIILSDIRNSRIQNITLEEPNEQND